METTGLQTFPAAGGADKGMLAVLLILAAAASLAAFVLWVSGIVAVIRGQRRSSGGTVWYLLLLASAIWCMRYAVGYYSTFCPTEELGNLSPFEEIFNSAVHTFQTFSMDEDYTLYTVKGKEMIAGIDGGERAVNAYGAFSALLNVLAPICGGAILLDILKSVFPGFRLALKRLLFWKKGIISAN